MKTFKDFLVESAGDAPTTLAKRVALFFATMAAEVPQTTNACITYLGRSVNMTGEMKGYASKHIQSLKNEGLLTIDWTEGGDPIYSPTQKLIELSKTRFAINPEELRRR